jgi:hypothetical protein
MIFLVCASGAIFIWGIWAAVIFYVWHFKMPRIDRIGYVEGIPALVACTCGRYAEKARQLKKDGAIWTEWICKNCIKVNL